MSCHYRGVTKIKYTANKKFMSNHKYLNLQIIITNLYIKAFITEIKTYKTSTEHNRFSEHNYLSQRWMSCRYKQAILTYPMSRRIFNADRKLETNKSLIHIYHQD